MGIQKTLGAPLHLEHQMCTERKITDQDIIF